MKRIIAIAFLLNLSVVSVYNLWQWSLFLINQEKITTELCENKDKPELECHGKCHLAKQLEKESETNTTSTSYKKISVVLFFVENVVAITPKAQTKYFYQPYSSKLLNGHSYRVSPPPKV